MSRRELFIEFAESAMHVLDGSNGIDIPLERDANGRVTSTSSAQAARTLREFFAQHGRTAPRTAACSIPARGVSLRRLSVPAAQKQDVRQLLAMQLEAQLPVPPAELAWGCTRLRETKTGGGGTLDEYLVVAVKREFLSDYTRLLAHAGVAAEYTISALARQALCPNAPAEYSILNSTGNRSELATFDGRGLTVLRVLPWGSDNPASLNGSLRNGLGQKLYITSGPPSAELLNASGAPVEVVPRPGGSGMSPANLGFREFTAKGAEPLLLGGYEPVTTASRPSAKQWNWAVLALVLALAALGLRYAEAVIFRARLSKKLAAIASYKATLPKIEKEFAFLHYIKTNQPPYLDTLAVLAAAAPPGATIDSLSLARQGNLSLRGSVGDAQGPGNFRSKLIDSGFFSRVVLDEQTPVQDGQKFNFRISAELKPDGLRKPLILQDSTNSPAVHSPGKR